MPQKNDNVDRRKFLKTIGTVGLTSALAGAGNVFASHQPKADSGEPNTIDPNTTEKSQTTKFEQVPRRKLGKTGIEVSCLSMGGGHNFVENQIVLKVAIERGINYWHTGSDYEGGNSELGIGKFLSKNPQSRDKLFLASEPPRAEFVEKVADMEGYLQTSLKRMNTNFLDWFGVHALSNPAQFTDELKQWAKGAKQRKLIRSFGFSTHTNMAECLAAAAKLDWIDVVMTSYNFRFMQDPKMQAALDVCHKAGIGIVAMKTQGLRIYNLKIETEEDKRLVRRFFERGFTEGQAKIKVVLADERISSACIGMYSVALLLENAAAALDKTKLTQSDLAVFKEYAQATRNSYCAGCAHICDCALPDIPCISDVMRCLMYYNSYGRQDMAREVFAAIPRSVRDRLLTTDYSIAEAHCTQRLPIGALVAEAVGKLA